MPGVEPGAGTYYLMPAGAIRVNRGQPGKLGPTEAILAIQGNSSPGQPGRIGFGPVGAIRIRAIRGNPDRG
jgi:hypothetical protein